MPLTYILHWMKARAIARAASVQAISHGASVHYTIGILSRTARSVGTKAARLLCVLNIFLCQTATARSDTYHMQIMYKYHVRFL